MKLRKILDSVLREVKTNKKSLLKEYYDDIVRDFYRHSLEGRMDEFDFQDAFDEMIGPLQNKLAEHGLMDFETFRDQMTDIYYELNEQLVNAGNNMSTDYVYIGGEALADHVWQFVYQKYQDEFSGYDQFQDLQDLYDEIQNANYSDTQAMTILFDKLIHAQHVTGDIYDDIDIEDLRQEVEDEWQEEKDQEIFKSRLAKFR